MDSLLKVDGKEVLTRGQCYSLKSQERCENRGCKFSETDGCIAPGGDNYIIKDFAGGEHCIEVFMQTTTSDNSRGIAYIAMLLLTIMNIVIRNILG